MIDPKANLDIGAGRKFADGLDIHANSDVPSIAPQSIQDQLTETISLSEHKNNLQILIRLLESGYRKARSSEAREVLSDAIRRIGAIGTAQRACYFAGGSTDVNGQDLVSAICANARTLFGSDVIDRLQSGQGGSSKRDSHAARVDHQ
jgi:two-component sensor histidine kinase